MSPSAPKILIVLTSHDKIDKLGKDTGWFLPEFAHPYWVFEEAGANMTIVSPKGGKAPLDPSSVEMTKDDKEAVKFLETKQSLWENTQKLGDFVGRESEFDAVFYVGGHGPMYDLANDEQSFSLIKNFYESGKVVSAVCHGPAAFVNVKLSDGSHMVKGNKVTGFSNAEEDQVQLSSAMPFMLETGLREHGAEYEKAHEPWHIKVVESGKDGRLMTGQNPASAAPLAHAIVKKVKKGSGSGHDDRSVLQKAVDAVKGA